MGVFSEMDLDTQVGAHIHDNTRSLETAHFKDAALDESENDVDPALNAWQTKATGNTVSIRKPILLCIEMQGLYKPESEFVHSIRTLAHSKKYDVYNLIWSPDISGVYELECYNREHRTKFKWKQIMPLINAHVITREARGLTQEFLEGIGHRTVYICGMNLLDSGLTVIMQLFEAGVHFDVLRDFVRFNSSADRELFERLYMRLYCKQLIKVEC